MAIPVKVKQILGGVRPPTWEEIEGLPLVITNNAGVYAQIVTFRYKVATAVDRYLCVGSATKCSFGMRERMWQHTEKSERYGSPKLHEDIGKGDLRRDGPFGTLMVVKMVSPSYEDVLSVRRTVTLTEAMLTIWLNALQSPFPVLQTLYSWEPRSSVYIGWSSHNPLTKDIVEPSDVTKHVVVQEGGLGNQGTTV